MLHANPTGSSKMVLEEPLNAQSLCSFSPLRQTMAFKPLAHHCKTIKSLSSHSQTLEKRKKLHTFLVFFACGALLVELSTRANWLNFREKENVAQNFGRPKPTPLGMHNLSYDFLQVQQPSKSRAQSTGFWHWLLQRRAHPRVQERKAEPCTVTLLSPHIQCKHHNSFAPPSLTLSLPPPHKNKVTSRTRNTTLSAGECLLLLFDVPVTVT